MSLTINWESLQSHYVEERIIRYIKEMVDNISNVSNDFSLGFAIERLKFGNNPPKVELTSMKDVDITTQWNLSTHDIVLSELPEIQFKAPFQASILVNWQSDFSSVFTVTLKVDLISPGCIKFPIRANLINIRLNGEATIQFLGDSLVIYFENHPDFSFSLELSMGGEEKLFDQIHVKGFLHEIIHEWISKNAVHPNALKIPL